MTVLEDLWVLRPAASLLPSPSPGLPTSSSDWSSPAAHFLKASSPGAAPGPPVLSHYRHSDQGNRRGVQGLGRMQRKGLEPTRPEQLRGALASHLTSPRLLSLICETGS